jgi:hypothetical protein
LSFRAWFYYPSHSPAPDWAHAFVQVVSDRPSSIDSRRVDGLQNDFVLSQLRPGLSALGYEVEAGKGRAEQGLPAGPIRTSR